MEKNLSVHQKKASKQPKATTKNKKQLKVVYISNPMRVETSPSEFRALVQELTGQDATDVPADPSKFPATPGVGDRDHQGVVLPDGGNKVLPESSDLSSEATPEDYVPELIERRQMPSNMWYD